MYNWRFMTEEQQQEVLKIRKLSGQPWHGPPHGLEKHWYHVSGTCYEHQPIIWAKLFYISTVRYLDSFKVNEQVQISESILILLKDVE